MIPLLQGRDAGPDAGPSLPQLPEAVPAGVQDLLNGISGALGDVAGGIGDLVSGLAGAINGNQTITLVGYAADGVGVAL